MLQIVVPAREGWDDGRQMFIESKEQVLQLEHSLVSISKWESKWEKSFLSSYDKTDEETLHYIKCMTITQNVNPYVYECLTAENVEEINTYINAPMTATTFPKSNSVSREIITSEVIYFWMIDNEIPFECQKWHLNRLLALIRVCNLKRDTSKNKMSKREIMNRNRSLNEARRKQLNTKG